MTIYLVLQNWSDYDNLKLKMGKEPRQFICSENWEVEYLVKKIRNIYPFIKDESIKEAIMTACNQLSLPHLREDFVREVLSLMGIPA